MKSYPSSIVECVWENYILLGERYREFAESLGLQNFNPEPAFFYCGSAHSLSERYANTLERYENYFGMPAPTKFWESVEDRFGAAPDNGQGIDESDEEKKHDSPDIYDPHVRVSFSVFRLIVTTAILNQASNAFDATKITLNNQATDDHVKATIVCIICNLLAKEE